MATRGVETLTQGKWSGVLVCVFSLVLTLPLLTMDTLPGVDFYQHAAILSSLKGLITGEQPGFGHYTLQPSLYLLPYLLALPLTALVEPITALTWVCFLGTLLYPLAIVAILKVRQEPAILALLALPLVYNSAFFWGFIALQLSIGLSLLAIAIMLMPSPSKAYLLGLSALGTLTALSHPYGPAMLLGFFALHCLFQRHLDLKKAVALLPSFGLLCGWALLGIKAQGHGEQWSYPGLEERIFGISYAIGSAYADGSDGLLMALTLSLIALVLLHQWASKSALDAPTKALLFFSLLNGGLYFILPESTEKTAFLHFRHALLAALILPAALSMPTLLALRRGAAVAGLGIALTASLIHIPHLRAFEREAAPIHIIAKALPPNPRVIFLPFDPEGAILTSHPYLNAGALIQATHGGFTLPDFPSLFWNLPLRRSTGPTLPLGLEWSPGRFRPSSPPEGLEFILLRAQDPGSLLPPLLKLGYEKVAVAPPYYLFRIPSPASSPLEVRVSGSSPQLRSAGHP